MSNPLLESPTGEEEGEKNSQSHLGPKTRETELRLGFTGFDDHGDGKVSCKRLSMGEQLQQWKLGSGFVKNGGFGYCAGAKRGFSDAIKGEQQETRDGFGNSWGFLQFQSTRGSGFVKDSKGLGHEKVVFDQKHQKSIEASPPVSTRAAPVVGWPPVRTFRKNLIQQPKPEMESEASPLVKQAMTNRFEDSLFVKVNVDGFPIGRKIDLKAYDGYESLSHGLQQMFNNFFAVERKLKQEIDPAASDDRVLIYEDNEGDRMLVGDVPWEMFISSVKRLWIISGSEAPILATTRDAKKQQ